MESARCLFRVKKVDFIKQCKKSVIELFVNEASGAGEGAQMEFCLEGVTATNAEVV